MDEVGDLGLELIAPIVATGEAGEVTLGMVGSELAVGPGDRALDVAQRRIDPFERGHTSSIGSRADADRATAVGALAEHTPTAEAVGDDRASRRQPMRRAARDLALAEASDRRQLELVRVLLGAGRDRRHEGRLVTASGHLGELGAVSLRFPNPRRCNVCE